MAKPSDGGLFDRFFRRPPQQSRSRALVLAIVQAFEAQLDEEGDLGAASIASLIRRAGVGAGSFYEYFESRDSLVGALVGTLTRRNYEELLAAVDALGDAPLDAKIEATARAVARAYLSRPRVTRAAIAGVARLGLHAAIVAERDRFARDLAGRVAAELPDRAKRERAMIDVADAAMGIVVGELERSATPDVERAADAIATLARALLRG